MGEEIDVTQFQENQINVDFNNKHCLEIYCRGACLVDVCVVFSNGGDTHIHA
jgi:hypothetical protein